jgi:glucose/arabinose dehydrogenase
MKATVPRFDPGARTTGRGKHLTRGGRRAAVLRGLVALAVGLSIVVWPFWAVPAPTAGAATPGFEEGAFAAQNDLRPAPLNELRPEGVWPPANEPWKASKSLLLPPGFHLNLYAKFPSTSVRTLAKGPGGALYVTRPADGAVDQLFDRNNDGFAEVRETVLSGLDCPHGMAVAGGWLYVAQLRKVERFPLVNGNGARTDVQASPDEPVTVGKQGQTIADDLPEGPCGDHGFRSLVVDQSQNTFYVGIGMLCNVCIDPGPEGALRATVRSYPIPAAPADAAASAQTQNGTARPGPLAGIEFSRGMRNVVFMALNPWDGSLWGGNVERDELGNDEPPEQITRIPAGGNFGWPYCYRGRDGSWRADNRVPAPARPCDELGLTTPTVPYQTHSTPLGLAFHDGKGMPASFGPSLFVALHGSWNHTTGVGYKLIRIPLDGDGQPDGTPQEFATGFLTGVFERAQEAAWARPAGLVVGDDNELFFADDKGGAVYRIEYTGR